MVIRETITDELLETWIRDIKASGLDDLRNKFLKVPTKSIKHMIEACILGGIMPHSWKQQNPVLVFKGRKPTEDRFG